MATASQQSSQHLALVGLTYEVVAEFCRKWKLRQFSLFGSILRDDFNSESDVDVLIERSPDSQMSLYDWINMQDELSEAVGRPVDIVDVKGLTNPFRRYEILRTRRVIYEA